MTATRQGPPAVAPAADVGRAVLPIERGFARSPEGVRIPGRHSALANLLIRDFIRSIGRTEA